MRIRVREAKDLEEGDIVGGEFFLGEELNCFKKAREVSDVWEHKYLTSSVVIQWNDGDREAAVDSRQKYVVIERRDSV